MKYPQMVANSKHGHIFIITQSVNITFVYKIVYKIYNTQESERFLTILNW